MTTNKQGIEAVLSRKLKLGRATRYNLIITHEGTQTYLDEKEYSATYEKKPFYSIWYPFFYIITNYDLNKDRFMVSKKQITFIYWLTYRS